MNPNHLDLEAQAFHVTLIVSYFARQKYPRPGHIDPVVALNGYSNGAGHMDYTHDELSSGLNFLTLSPRGGYTRGELGIEVDTLLGRRVARVLEQLREMGGAPAAIEVAENGTEFTSCVLDQSADQHHVALHFIERGEPKQITFIGSFIGKFRDECRAAS
jgi:putative transposase